MPCGPVPFGDWTSVTFGILPSTDRPGEAASLLAPASPDTSRFASLPASSLIVPPLRDRAEPWSRLADS